MARSEGDPSLKVELHLASGAIVKWTLTPEWLRTVHPRASSAVTGTDRDGFREAATNALDWLFDPKVRGDHIEVVDAEGAYWMIEGSAVIAVRLVDPQPAAGGARTQVGFLFPPTLGRTRDR